MNPSRIPKPMIGGVVVLCLAPIVLNLAGLDFGSPPEVVDLSAVFGLETDRQTQVLREMLSGTLTHTMLDWTAVWTALFTAFAALFHYRMRGDITSSIIASSLICAGILDAFHIFTASHLLTRSVAAYAVLNPFTWVISRVFYAAILIVGPGLFLFVKASSSAGREQKRGFRGILGFSLAFGILAFVVFYALATSSKLPKTLFPDSLVTRPWDLIPLVLFVGAGLIVLPIFCRKYPSLFSHALWLSILPAATTQLHMAFGSTALFDNHFNIAHFLKVVAYLVPLGGLLMDYQNTYRKATSLNSELRVLNAELERRVTERTSDLNIRSDELARSNQELEQFAYVASHDLQEPLRAVAGCAQLIQQLYRDKLDSRGDELIQHAVDGSLRMQNLISNLLTFSRVRRRAKPFESVDCSEILKRVVANLSVAIRESGAAVTYTGLPTVKADPTQLLQLFQNLIANAIKFRSEQRPDIRIAAARKEGEWLFSVSDNGIGIEPQYAERVFGLFQRLHTRREFEGTGIGLALCKKVVEQHAGRIWLVSEFGKGSAFHFTIPL